jgi:Domain of unknown function (DUF4124)
MKSLITLCLCIILLLASQIAKSDIYKSVGTDGKVTYSNVPLKGFIRIVKEWEKISVSDDRALYMDSDTLRKNGDKVKMWVLSDFNTAQETGGGKQFSSIKAQFESDCKLEQYRTVSSIYHSGNMGNGNVIQSFNIPTIFEPVPPASIAETLWKIACLK